MHEIKLKENELNALKKRLDADVALESEENKKTGEYNAEIMAMKEEYMKKEKELFDAINSYQLTDLRLESITCAVCQFADHDLPVKISRHSMKKSVIIGVCRACFEFLENPSHDKEDARHIRFFKQYEDAFKNSCKQIETTTT